MAVITPSFQTAVLIVVYVIQRILNQVSGSINPIIYLLIVIICYEWLATYI